MKKVILTALLITGGLVFVTCDNSGNGVAVKDSTKMTNVKATEQESCTADDLFPIAKPDNAEPDSGQECQFYKWAWQTFLYITQPEKEGGKPRFLGYETPTNLFGVGATPLFEKLPANKMLLLAPRLEKDSVATSLDEVLQANSRGILIDQNGRAVYYAQHVNDVFAKFVRDNGYTNMTKLLAAPADQVFPVGSLELKSSWKIVMPGDDTTGFYTTKAMIAKFVTKVKDGKPTIEIDPNQTKEETVALLGIHVVGVVQGHPEFIWATFEHDGLAPNLKDKDPSGTVPLDNDLKDKFLLYKTGTAAKDCNQKPGQKLVFEEESKQTFRPVTSVFHHFSFDDEDDLIISINNSIHELLVKNKIPIWNNYSFKGAVWLNNPKEKFQIGHVFSDDDKRDTTIIGGEKELSNVTMETFTQPNERCFSCHKTNEEFKGELEFPAKKLSVSHILTNAYFNSQQQKLNLNKFVHQ